MSLISSAPTPADYATAVRELQHVRVELDALRATRTFRWSEGPRRLYGQLRRRGPSAEGLRAHSSPYAASRDIRDPSECWFYHSIDLPRHGTIEGQWDSRPVIDDYLGHVEFSGKRVLEIGPASGFVTMAMERRGASVVSVELPNARGWDLFPTEGADLSARRSALAEHLERLHNSYWLVHREFELSAQVHYGPVSPLSQDLGEFDVSFLGCVLLHSHDPIGQIISCAQRTKETFIITDVRSTQPDSPDRQGGAVCVLVPSADNQIIDTWWTFSPELLVQLLGALGFRRATVTFHEQRYATDPEPHPMFTVVASRTS